MPGQFKGLSGRPFAQKNEGSEFFLVLRQNCSLVFLEAILLHVKPRNTDFVTTSKKFANQVPRPSEKEE